MVRHELGASSEYFRQLITTLETYFHGVASKSSNYVEFVNGVDPETLRAHISSQVTAQAESETLRPENVQDLADQIIRDLTDKLKTLSEKERSANKSHLLIYDFFSQVVLNRITQYLMYGEYLAQQVPID